MTAYYNEIDEYAAQWLRNLIAAGHIAPGDVDTRSIEDVTPDDIKNYAQCHFFAGIGVWSYALRRAGVDDNRRVWTGSCPCQPFSVAGKGDGFADERHLWPAFHWLIEQCRPVVVFGEQVASKDGYAWLDLVQTDLEGTGYTVGAVVAPAAGFGAPHQRHRMYWVADSNEHGQRTGGRAGLHSQREPRPLVAQCGEYGGLADAADFGQHGRGSSETGNGGTPRVEPERLRDVGGLGNTGRAGLEKQFSERGTPRETSGGTSGQALERTGTPIGGLADTGNKRRDGQYPLLQRKESGRVAPDSVEVAGNSPTRGFWSAADWVWCRDEKYRPIEPIVEQMADGSTASLGRVCPATVQEIEKEIAYAIRYQADPGKTLFDLRQAVQQDAVQRGIGRLQGVHETPILLAFLRQLTEQGWAFSESFSCPSPKTKEIVLRILRNEQSATGAPLGRGLDEQQPGEPADFVCFLSSILARYAQKAWGETFDKNARATNPLIVGGNSRVGRLRAYGNAICAPQATEFIKAYLEVRP